MVTGLPQAVQTRQQIVQRGGQGLFGIFLQQVSLPGSGKLFSRALLADDVGHTLEGLHGLGIAGFLAELGKGG